MACRVLQGLVCIFVLVSSALAIDNADVSKADVSKTDVSKADVSKTDVSKADVSKTEPSKTTRPVDLSSLSEQGRAQFESCNRSLEADSSLSSLLGTQTVLKWELPKDLPPSKDHEDLGWVDTSGLGIYTAKAYESSCFVVAARTREGELFDQGCLQRASFMGNLSSVPGKVKLNVGTKEESIRFAADVTYVPSLSMHKVCFTAPSPGLYNLDLSLMFTNTLKLQTARVPGHTSGFANYAVVLSTVVNVTAEPKFLLYLHRKRSLPECTLEKVAELKNRGFWVGHRWLPYGCRLHRPAPITIMKWLNGKNVLFLGDSEMRYLYGVLQLYLSSKSRSAFELFLKNHPWHRGSKLEVMGLPGHAEADEPPREAGTDLARHIPYSLATGYSIFFGGKYSGFGHQRLRFKAVPSASPSGPFGKGVDFDFNITYVSFFSPADELFSKWMADGNLTMGFKAYEGRPFDMVIEGSLLHGVLEFDSAKDYGEKLSSRFLPQLKKVCPPESCTFASFGPWVGMEAWKPTRFVHMSNNPRNFVFENEAYDVLRRNGRPNYVHVDSLTTPVRGSELAADPAHYRGAVSMAMLDVLFGSLCNTTSGPAI